MMTTIKKRHGFTLVEIMACMIIISIVTSITLPAIDNFRSGDRVKADAQLLVSAIRHAKYTALQDNVLIRIIFNEDNSCFKEQICKSAEFNDDGTLKPDSSTTLEAIIKRDGKQISEKNTDGSYNVGNNWESIDDTDETEFSPATEIEVDGTLDPKVLYFKSDGYIYTYSKTPSPDGSVAKISEIRVLFKYGSAALAVDVNTLGVLSSEAFAYNGDDEDIEEQIEW